MAHIGNWVLAVFFAILPALFWLMIWYRKDFVQPEPKEMVIKAFFFGMLAVLPFVGVQFMLERSQDLLSLWDVFARKSFFISTLTFTFLLAAFEEGMKHFSVLGLGKKLDLYFDQIIDGIIYSVAAALGFAFMENVLYFANALLFAGISAEFWKVFIFRSFGTMLGHTIFSGIFGFFWGHALFSLQLYHRQKRGEDHGYNFLDTLRFRIIFERILHEKPGKAAGSNRTLLREAFLLATVAHTIFNLFLVSEVFGETLTPLAAPFLLLGFLYLSHQFLMKRNVKIWKLARA